MKKHLFCLILISCFLAIQSSHAAKPKDPIDITINGITYRLNEKNEASALKADLSLKEAHILDKVEYQGNEYPVTHMFAVFADNVNLISVVIGDNVKSMTACFWDCPNLTSVTFGKSIVEIGNNVFRNCTSLKSLTIPNTVTTLGESTFNGCNNLTSITFTDTVRTIGKECFKDCIGLTSITFPKNINNIGESAFENCSGLTSVTLAYSSDATLGKNMFKGCTALNTINISDHVTNLGERAFSGCSGLQTVTVPGNIKESGDYIFLNCTNIISAKFEEGYNLIPIGMFEGCENLKA